MTERKYAMIRIEAGDWILPGNDGETIFRLRRGTGFGEGGRPRPAWEVWKWIGPWDADAAADSVIDGDWEPWDLQVSGLRTRTEAIGEALR